MEDRQECFSAPADVLSLAAMHAGSLALDNLHDRQEGAAPTVRARWLSCHGSREGGMSEVGSDTILSSRCFSLCVCPCVRTHERVNARLFGRSK